MANLPNRLFHTILPLGILAAGVLAFIAFGKVEPKRRAAPGNSPSELLFALPPAEVDRCRDFSELDQVLDVRANGEVVPYREVQQAAEVGGRIVFKSSICEAGNYVQKDDLLLKIDPTDYQLEVERIEKVEQQERQALVELDQEMSNTNNLLKLMREELTLRDKEIDRLNKLPGGFASDAELDKSKSAKIQTMNQIVQLENQVQLLNKRRTRLESAVLLAATQLKRSTEDLKRTEVRAATSGVIVKENVELDSFVQRGAIVVTLEATEHIEVAVDLRMDQLYWILNQQVEGTQPSTPATALPLDEPRTSNAENGPSRMGGLSSGAKLYSLPETPVTIVYRLSGREDQVFRWQGKLQRYDGLGLSPQTRMVPVRILVDQPQRTPGNAASVDGPRALMRGMFVEAVIHTRPKASMVLVPHLALRPGGRVWKFTPDPSVIEPKTSSSANDSASLTAAVTLAKNEVTEPDESPEVSFDPTAWRAGRVDVIDGLRAISETTLPKRSVSLEDDPTTKTETERFWICEVPNEKLLPGDLIVTTPLSGIEVSGTDNVRIPVTSQP